MKQESNFYVTTPFTRELPIGLRLKLGPFEEAITELTATIEKRMAGSLIAPAGSGKTVILRGIGESLPAARFKVTYIKVTDLSARDMCREIATAIGAKPASLFNTLVKNIQESLAGDYQTNGLKPVLLIDEAQEMRPAAVSILNAFDQF